jgi:hypothetical protein
MSAVFGVIAIVVIAVLKILKEANEEASSQHAPLQYSDADIDKYMKYVGDPKYNPYNT